MPADPDETLLRPYHAVRRVSAAIDGPWAGMLCRLASGEAAVLVDAATLPGSWRGWQAEASGHLLAPIDLVRRSDGHDVLVPLCTVRLSEYLTLRAVPETTLTPGEAVTIAVSVLRGLCELRTHGDGDPRGEWWLTDAGRPILATETSSSDAVAATADLLGDVSAAFDSATAARIRDFAAGERFAIRELERIEHALFEIAEPTPLSSVSTTRTGAHAGGSALAEFAARNRQADAVADVPEQGTRSARQPWQHQLARHVDADLSAVISDAATSAWRRMRRLRVADDQAAGPARSVRPPRRRMWLLASAAAMAVLAVGVMWPGDPDTASADGSAPAPSETATSAPPVDDLPADDGLAANGDVGTTGDSTAPPAIALADTAQALLTARTSCEADSACLASVVVAVEREFAAGVIDVAASERTATLVDEFGGVAVVRIDSIEPGAPAQLVVIEQRDAGWLLRDVYPASTQQP